MYALPERACITIPDHISGGNVENSLSIVKRPSRISCRLNVKLLFINSLIACIIKATGKNLFKKQSK